jgi:Leucine-rich repeat (LRR) protein
MNQHLNITSIQATNLKLTKLSKAFSKTRCFLKSLNLSHNRIAELDNYEFYGLESLENLSLANNLLTYIKDYAFQNLGNIQRLDISHNHLQQLEPGVFKPLKSAKELNVNNNRLIMANLTLYDNTEKLVTLNLSNNRIETILRDDRYGTKVLDFSRHKLAYLDLGQNRLTTITFKRMPNFGNLRDINLQDNNLTEFICGDLEEYLPKLKKMQISVHKLDNATLDVIDRCFNYNGINQPLKMDVYFMLSVAMLVDMAWTLGLPMWHWCKHR